MNLCQRSMSFAIAALLIASFVPATIAQNKETPPTLEEGAADHSKKVQVYIMLGQSNMLGFGAAGPVDKQGTLEYMIKEKGKYRYLIDDAGWVERKDVRFVHTMGSGTGNARIVHNTWLKPAGRFGPEVGFGHKVGESTDAPVLLLKSCIGNRSLGWDLLPPGSESFEHEEKDRKSGEMKTFVYAGYKQSPLRWEKGTEPEPISWYAGMQYDGDIRNAKDVLKKLDDFYPGYKGQGYEIAGFVWWQGHKDQNAAHAGRYEQNLVHLIKTLRKEFESPDAKFVIATIAFGGDKLDGHGLTVAEAQLAVDGQKGIYPAFKGNVASIDARSFWREADVSPKNQGYHYNHNAETYMEVGLALGEAAVKLHKSEK